MWPIHSDSGHSNRNDCRPLASANPVVRFRVLIARLQCSVKVVRANRRLSSKQNATLHLAPLEPI